MPTAADLEARFARWQVWLADSGMWWASVRRNLTPSQDRAGCATFLSAETTVELEQLLRDDAAKLGAPQPPRLPVRLVVWGVTDADVEHAIRKASQAERRHTWEFIGEPDRHRSTTCAITDDDGPTIAQKAGYHWAYAVYPTERADG